MFRIDSETGIYVVSDGLGGHDRGVLASQMACSLIPQFAHSFSMETQATWPFEKQENLTLEENYVRLLLLKTNTKIVERARYDHVFENMGSSVLLLMTLADRFIVANVGNCRAYLYRKSDLFQLTQDDSLAEYKKIKPTHAHTNIPLQFMGKSDPLSIRSIDTKVPKVKDIYLLLSSGVLNALSDTEIHDHLNNVQKFETLSKTLVTAASQKTNAYDLTCLAVLFSG